MSYSGVRCLLVFLIVLGILGKKSSDEKERKEFARKFWPQFVSIHEDHAIDLYADGGRHRLEKEEGLSWRLQEDEEPPEYGRSFSLFSEILDGLVEREQRNTHSDLNQLVQQLIGDVERVSAFGFTCTDRQSSFALAGDYCRYALVKYSFPSPTVLERVLSDLYHPGL